MKNQVQQELRDGGVVKVLSKEEREIRIAEIDSDIEGLKIEIEELENLMNESKMMKVGNPSSFQSQLIKAINLNKLILDLLFLIKSKLTE